MKFRYLQQSAHTFCFNELFLFYLGDLDDQDLIFTQDMDQGSPHIKSLQMRN